jgi:hypothetical protein
MVSLVDESDGSVISNIRASLKEVKLFTLGAYSGSNNIAFYDISDRLSAIIEMFDRPDKPCKEVI